jgi:hypothetical protein
VAQAAVVMETLDKLATLLLELLILAAAVAVLVKLLLQVQQVALEL